METIKGKEGKGVQGTGFDSAGVSSNSYSQLPSSSNAAFGIDANVAAGVSEAAGTPDSHMQNSGPAGADGNDDTMGVAKKFALDADVVTGTVRGGLEGVTAKRSPGVFGVSAKSGNPPAELNEDEYYGSGARKSGTAAQFGEPGRGGSMALAARGLSGNTSGASGKAVQPAQGAQKSKVDAQAGLKGSNSSD